MKFNTEITVTSPLTNETTKWQGPQIEAETLQEAEKAAFAAIVYVSGENVPREALSVQMQPPRSLAVAIQERFLNDIEAVICLLQWTQLYFEKYTIESFDFGIEHDKIKSILRILNYQVFNPLDPEVIEKKNHNLFHPNFVSKLDEAEAIGGVVISYLPEV